MELALILGWALTVCAFLLFVHKQEERDAAERGRTDASHAEDRRVLLNRLQAPQMAAYEASGEPSEEPLYVPFEDDDAHEAYEKQRKAGEAV